MGKYILGILLACSMVSSAWGLTLEWDGCTQYNIFRSVLATTGDHREFIMIGNTTPPVTQWVDGAIPVGTSMILPRVAYKVNCVNQTGSQTQDSNTQIAGQFLPGRMFLDAETIRAGISVRVRFINVAGATLDDKITFHVAYDSPFAVVQETLLSSPSCTVNSPGNGECMITVPGWISGQGPWDFRYRSPTGDVLAMSRAVVLQ